MKKSIVISLLIAIAAAAWVFSGVFSSEAEEPTPRKPAAQIDREEQAVAVRVRTMSAEDHQKILSIRGASEAVRQVNVKSEISGQIAEVYVRDGNTISEGDPIVRIEDNDRSARLQEAKALLEQRRVELNASRELASKGYRSNTDLAAAQAAYQAAQAAVEQAEIAVARLTVAAPFDAIADDVVIELGDYIDIGDPVAQLVQLDPIRLTAHVAETHVSDIEVGEAASARLVNGDEVFGMVISVAAAANPETRTFKVKMEVANPDGDISVGMTAELLLPLRTVRAHFVSPAVLTLRDDGRLGVMAVGPEKRAIFLEANILEDTADGVWLGGLPDTFELITVGQEFIVEGQALDPVPEDQIGAGSDATS
jgi:multidrug efflux system membrane fusion protein